MPVDRSAQERIHQAYLAACDAADRHRGERPDRSLTDDERARRDRDERWWIEEWGFRGEGPPTPETIDEFRRTWAEFNLPPTEAQLHAERAVERALIDLEPVPTVEQVEARAQWERELDSIADTGMSLSLLELMAKRGHPIDNLSGSGQLAAYGREHLPGASLDAVADLMMRRLRARYGLSVEASRSIGALAAYRVLEGEPVQAPSVPGEPANEDPAAVVERDRNRGASPVRKRRKEPTGKAFIAYRLRTLTDWNQDTIARKMSDELHTPIRQDNISKWVDRVREWLNEGNVLPDMGEDLPTLKRIKTDPETIERGRRLDGRR